MKMTNGPLIKSLESLTDSESYTSITAVKAELSAFSISSTSNEEEAAKDLYIVFYTYIKVTKKRFIDELHRKIRISVID